MSLFVANKFINTAFFFFLKISSYLERQTKIESKPAQESTTTVPEDITRNREVLKQQASAKTYLAKVKHGKRIATRFDFERVDDNDVFDDSDLIFVNETSMHTVDDVSDVLLEDGSESQYCNMLPNPISFTSTPVHMMCIRVVKAWNLPETLGDTNPFVIIDWGGEVIN
jgi:hypothetical protein